MSTAIRTFAIRVTGLAVQENVANRRTCISLLALVAYSALSTVCPLAHAGLTAYDSFGYAATNAISGANGGTGWTSPWTGTNDVTIPGLDFPNLQTSGNKVTTDGGNAASFRNLSSAMITGGAAPIFISFLANSTSAISNPDFSYAGISLYDSTTGTEQLFMGMAFGQVNYGWDIQPGTGVGAINSGGPAVNGTVDLLVYRLSQGVGGTTNVELYANPTPGDPLPAPTASRLDFRTNFGFDQIRIAAGGGTDVNLNFDELRIGDSFASVTPVPEPGSMALSIGAGVSIAAFLYRAAARTKRHRRKR